MTTIEISTTDDPNAFDVAVHEETGVTHHHVTVPEALRRRFADGASMPEHLVEAAFRFLLDREPKEAILPRFDLGVIARYFPDFERELPNYLA